MGISCGCNKILDIQEDLNMEKEKKINKDFFIDYSIDNIKMKKDQSFEDEIKIKPSNTLNSAYNDLPIFSTQSYSYFNNNKPTFINESNNKNVKEKIFEEEDDKEIFIEDNKEKDKELFIEDDDMKKTEDNYSMNGIKLKSKKHKLNNNNTIDGYNSNIYGNQLINNSSSERIDIDKYKNENITDMEYNLEPKDNYCLIIFNYINQLRKNPKYIAKMIEENKKYIFTNKENDIYFKKNKIKINLNKGLPIFNETINILNNLKPLNKLIFNKNITIDLPDNIDYINNSKYLEYQVEEIQKNGYYISSYWKEKIKNPEVAFIMMVVDDNSIGDHFKRRDLINPEIKYIGITSIEIDNNFACYITLSKEKDK